MSQMSNYLENALINGVLRNIPYTPPVTLYVALYTSNPTDADTGTEVSTGAYVRQIVTFAAPTDGVSSNNNEITFPVATTNWGTITHVGIKDAITGGNLLFYGALSISKVISSGDAFKILAGNLSITLA